MDTFACMASGAVLFPDWGAGSGFASSASRCSTPTAASARTSRSATWRRTCSSPKPASRFSSASGKSPLLGVHNGTAVYLLFNGVLGDKRPAGGNVLTHAIAQDLPAHPNGDGPRIVYGEACRLGPKSLAQYGLTFRQVPFELKVD